MATVDPVLKWSFLAVGVFGFGFAAFLARRPIALLRAGGKAQGTVTRSESQLISSSKGPARTYHFPHIEFTTAKGEKIAFRSAVGRGVALEKGTVVPLIYDPANPQDASIRSFGHLWLFPTVLCVLTLPFLLVGLAGLFSG